MRQGRRRSGWAGVLGLVLLFVPTVPLRAQVEPTFPTYTGDQFNELFTSAPLDGLAPVGPAPAITGDASVDERIRSIAEDRGYLRRPLALDLVTVDGTRLHPAAAAAWEALQAEADRQGYSLRLLDGHRTFAAQRSIFLRDLDDYSSEEIDRQLRWAAAPGYSKHHTGYAVDITQSGWPAGSFDASPAGQWMAADGYRVAQQFGFIPSYPPDASRQGPEPEPWEWTYVGVDVIRCGGFHLGYAGVEEPANPTGTVWDLDVCGDLALTRGAAAHYLARVLGLEGGGRDRFVDDDDNVHQDAIEAVAAAGITDGCNPPARDRFCPQAHLTRGELASFLDRALGSAPTSVDHFHDDDGSRFEASIDRLAAAGVIRGCNPPDDDRFCPDEAATRATLLAFLGRALDLPPRPPAHQGAFQDDEGHLFEGDIDWLAEAGITRGCNPPANDRFCPDRAVTRGQMAAFLARTLRLESTGVTFVDTEGSPFAPDIAALAAAGITRGCNPPHNDRFCPGQPVTRGQMAAFLVRALPLAAADYPFVDTAGHVFHADIAALAAAGITRGCNPPDNDRFCPDQPVTRAQMAAFLRRAIG